MVRIYTENAPAAIGPYSQAIKTNGFVFTSGQIALDPATGEVVAGGITEQTVRICENLKAVLAEAGSSLDKVVKTTCFLADMNDFSAFNNIYGQYFTQNPPEAVSPSRRFPRASSPKSKSSRSLKPA